MDGGPPEKPWRCAMQGQENPSKESRHETRAVFVSSVPLGELCGGNRKASDPCVNCIPSSLSLESVSLRRVAQSSPAWKKRGREVFASAPRPWRALPGRQAAVLGPVASSTGSVDGGLEEWTGKGLERPKLCQVPPSFQGSQAVPSPPWGLAIFTLATD